MNETVSEKWYVCRWSSFTRKYLKWGWGNQTKSIELIVKRGFNLHNSYSNISLLEKSGSKNNDELTYAKQLFPNKTSNTKILGLGWNNASDTLFIIIPTCQQKSITKRNIISYVASIYNSLGFISPSHVIGKAIYRELCNERVPWDAEVSVGLKRKTWKWMRDINNVKTELPRSIPLAQDSVTAIDLHVFADASIVAICAAV